VGIGRRRRLDLAVCPGSDSLEGLGTRLYGVGYTGARARTFARSAGNNCIPKRDRYIHTHIHRNYI